MADIPPRLLTTSLRSSSPPTTLCAEAQSLSTSLARKISSSVVSYGQRSIYADVPWRSPPTDSLRSLPAIGSRPRWTPFPHRVPSSDRLANFSAWGFALHQCIGFPAQQFAGAGPCRLDSSVRCQAWPGRQGEAIKRTCHGPKGGPSGPALDMNIHLVDGTYELFRAYFGAPPRQASDGREVGATIGLLRSLLSLLAMPGKTHVACAFDHVIESFRNDLFHGYKTGEGVDPDLMAQFPLAEEAVSALGLVVWPMIEFEADDALASAAARFKDAPGVEQVVICSPDKDLMQCVTTAQVVCWDRRRDIVYDEEGVLKKFGVRPHSIPDWLALVGDSADGYPGIPGWGAKSASAVLFRYEHLESIPQDHREWGLAPARASRLAESLRTHQQEVLLFRRLATLRDDVPLREELNDLEWRGARGRLKELCREWGEDELPKRNHRWRDSLP